MVKVLSLNLVEPANNFYPEIRDTLHHLKDSSKLILEETDSLQKVSLDGIATSNENPYTDVESEINESAKISLSEFDILLLSIDETNTKLWRDIADYLDEDAELAYLGCIVIFCFDENVRELSQEAVQRGLSAFACPFNPSILEAHIQATFSVMRSYQLLRGFEEDLYDAESLSEIADIAFKQLKNHPKIGYVRACISLVDHTTGQRYLLRHDPAIPNPDRSFFGNIEDDKLLTRLVEENVIIFEDLITLRTNEKSELSDFGWQQNNATDDVNSWLGLSIMRGKRCVGIVTLDHREPGHYKKHDEKITAYLMGYADILGGAIHEISQRRNERILREIFYEIGNMLDSQSLIEKILENIRDELNCSYCSYFKISSSVDKEEVFLEEWFNVVNKEDLPLKVASRKRIFKKFEGVVGAVLADGHSRIIPHALESTEFQPSPIFSGTNLSILAIPVVASNNSDNNQARKMIGVIACYKTDKDFFTIYDRELLESISRCTATVIERTMTLEYLNDISAKMNELVLEPDKKALVKRICEHALKITSARAAVIHRFQHENKPTGEYYSFPEEIPPILPRIPGEGTTKRMLKSRKTEEFSEMFGNYECISNALRDKGVKYHIVVPLKIKKGTPKEEIIGGLYLNKYHKEPFSELEKFALELLASHASNIIYHQDFFTHKQTWAKGNAGLAKAIEKIARMDDPDLLLKDIAHYSRDLSGASFSYVSLMTEQGDLEVKATWPEYVFSQLADFLQSETPRMKKEKGIVSLCAEQAKTILIEDIKQEEKDDSELWHQYIEFDPEICSELAVPIKENTSGKVIGVINLEHSQPCTFSEVHKEVIEHFARQVAIAFQKKSLVDSVKNLNGILIGLQKSLRKIIESPAQNMLENVVALTREAINADEVFVFPVSRKQWSPKVLDEGIVPSVNALSRSDLKSLKTISLEVYRSQQLKYYRAEIDGQNQSGPLLLSPNQHEKRSLKSGLCIPFSSRDLRIGVMWIFFSKNMPEELSEEERAIYQVYADQIALAFNNAQKSQDLQDKFERNKFELTKNIDKNYKDARTQAGFNFFLSASSSLVGIILIFFSVFSSFSEDKKSVSNELGQNLSVVAGILLQGVTILAFRQAEKANERMDNYHRELFNVRQLEILLSATDQLDAETSLSVKQEIVKTAADSWIQDAKQIKQDIGQSGGK